MEVVGKFRKGRIDGDGVPIFVPNFRCELDLTRHPSRGQHRLRSSNPFSSRNPSICQCPYQIPFHRPSSPIVRLLHSQHREKPLPSMLGVLSFVLTSGSYSPQISRCPPRKISSTRKHNDSKRSSNSPR